MLWLAFYKLFGDKLVSAFVIVAVTVATLSFCYMGYAIVASPVFRALLSNPVSRKKLAKEFDDLFMFNALVRICRTLLLRSNAALHSSDPESHSCCAFYRQGLHGNFIGSPVLLRYHP